MESCTEMLSKLQFSEHSMGYPIKCRHIGINSKKVSLYSNLDLRNTNLVSK